VQKFLSTLVSKPPEVGHLVTCFHAAKTPDVKTNAVRKVTTFSAIQNFEYQSWRDFSDVLLVEPSVSYPIIEIEIVLNFFPGDHFTAERYKAFVVQTTKQHSGKDAKINIDDYFHIEDHREWTFFVGKHDLINPWWSKGFPRFLISGLLFFGWPFRMNYHGKVAKHQIEVKKAVFCENTSQDEGVSLTATPGSGSNAEGGNQQQAKKENPTTAAAVEEEDVADAPLDEETKEKAPPPHPDKVEEERLLERTDGQPASATVGTQASGSMQNVAEQQYARQTTLIHQPPSQQVVQQSYHRQVHQPPAAAVVAHHGHHQHGQRHGSHHHAQRQHQLPPLYPSNQASSSLAAVATGVPGLATAPPPLRVPSSRDRGAGDLMTAVAHAQQDVNGVKSVNTIALKDIDVQMSNISGYETYV